MGILDTLAQADALAREFGQGGTLCWSTGEPVRLRMMWPRPAEAGDDPLAELSGNIDQLLNALLQKS